MSQVNVRPRSVGDLAACVETLRQVQRVDGYPSFWPSDPTSWIAPAEEQAAWVVVDTDASVLGHVALHSVEEHPAFRFWGAATGRAPECLAAVRRMFVAPSMRRCGLGRTLLNVATEHALNRSLYPVLDVAQDNHTAIHLYESCGWRRVGEVGASSRRPIAVFAYVGPSPSTTGRTSQ